MQIQINTDHNIVCHDSLANKLRDMVENALSHMKEHISRVDVFISDEINDKKSGIKDTRCVMEAHLDGRPAVVVTHQATTVDLAAEGAAEKLTNMVEHTLGRMRDQRHHARPHEPHTVVKP